MLTTYVLANDIVRKRGFLAEHGLSLLIRSDHRTVLFDVGQSGVYIGNAMKLGLDIAKADSIVLSHGHYDHCGGLEYFPVSDGNPDVYIRSEALEEKFAENPDGSFRNVGIPLAARESTAFREKRYYRFMQVCIWRGFLKVHLTVYFPILKVQI
ncbi:MAG: MBL fold metallo-hydrolase [Saccharofermentanales bacterium]